MRIRSRVPRNPVTWLVVLALALGVPLWLAGILAAITGWRASLAVFVLGVWAWFLWRLIQNHRGTWYDFQPTGVTVHEMSTDARFRTRTWHRQFRWDEIGYLEAADRESIRFWYGPLHSFTVWFAPDQVAARTAEFRQYQGGGPSWTFHPLPGTPADIRAEYARGVRTTVWREAGLIRAAYHDAGRLILGEGGVRWPGSREDWVLELEKVDREAAAAESN